MPGKVILEVTKGPLQGQVFTFEEHDTFIFGRGKKNCHAHLPGDGLMSRHHFILEANPPDARLRDLGSLNGTIVNGVTYGGRAPDETPEQGAARNHPHVDLSDGDEIRIGATCFRVRIEVPLQCDQCGALIADSDNEAQARPGRVWCVECRQRFATQPRKPAGLPRLPTVMEDLQPSDSGSDGGKQAPARQPTFVENFQRCQQCGQDVSQEIGKARRGDYICQKCRTAAKSDPLALVRRLMQDAAQKTQQPEQPQISGYDIVKKLGEGGMGSVYLAKCQKTGKEVAVKLMLSKVAVDRHSRDIFMREIEVTQNLRHPNIVQFVDRHSSGGAFYFVMELCNRGSLDNLLHKNPLPLKTGGPLMLQVLRGLHFAHEQGVVHRDLKPANILLHQDAGKAIAKVSDFGLAKCFEKAGFSGMTASGTFAGTFAYMPREQLSDYKRVRPVSDVWSIAATFYMMLSGQLPRDFSGGKDPADVVLKGKTVPLRQRNAAIPAQVAGVIDRALADETSDRYQTAAEFHDALKQALKARSH